MSLNWKDWPAPIHSSAEIAKEIAENFEFYDDDVVISTYHKCGTTLMQQIVSCLMFGIDVTRQVELPKRIPFIELKSKNSQTSLEVARSLPRPRAMKTHLPPAFLPLRHLSREVGPKNLVVMRNPKDMVVSAFHHFSAFTDMKQFFPLANFHEFWRAHMLESDKIGNIDFFDFNLSWWSFRDHPRVLILFYEDLIRNKEQQVRRVAEFLGLTVSDELIQQTLEVTSFNWMKMAPPEYFSLIVTRPSDGPALIRKGEVGDWKNHFSEEDSRLMDEIIEGRLRGTDLTFTYE